MAWASAEQAYAWSGGRAIFASGSPFAPVTFDGQTFVPGQGNNSYVFPGIGLGALVSDAREVTDAMFLIAAPTLARLVTDADLRQGRVYPALSQIRDVSLEIAIAVATEAYDQGLARSTPPPRSPHGRAGEHVRARLRAVRVVGPSDHSNRLLRLHSPRRSALHWGRHDREPGEPAQRYRGRDRCSMAGSRREVPPRD